MRSLSELATEWLQAKKNEQAATAARIAVEEQIIALTGKKDEGAQTHNEGDFKVVVTGKISRKMDWAKWATIKDSIPIALRPVKLKEELDERGVKYLQQNEPAIYELLPLTVTPAKTEVKVEVKA
jgi:hypothetical protein